MKNRNFICIALLFVFTATPSVFAQNAYREAMKETVESKAGKLISKAKRAQDCLDKLSDCVNNSEQVQRGVESTVDKVVKANECASTSDPEKQKACLESAKAGYQRKKQEKQQKQADEAAKWRWDGQTGRDVRLCMRGKNKPVGFVLAVTPSKVKVEINQSGGNMFRYYQVGEEVWVDRNKVGC